MSTYDLYGLGAALVDTEIDVTDADLQDCGIAKGLMTLVDAPRQQQLLDLLRHHLTRAERASGGSAANSVIAAQYFGASTFYSCKVADDDNGRFYLQDLARAGVSYSPKSVVPQGSTGRCLVMISPDAERTMNTYLGVSEQLSVAELDTEALGNSRFLYLEGYLVTSATAKPAAIRARELAEQQGVKTAMSLSDPGIVEFFYDGLQQMLGNGVDILFCNQAEALKFTHTEDLDSAVDSLKRYARTFAITCGAKGCLVFDGERLTQADAPTVDALDTNGAGDMFAGAFLFALSQNHDYRRAAHFANRAAALVVSQYGPRLAPAQYRNLLNWL